MSLAQIDKSVNQALQQVMKPAFVRGVVHLLLVLYVVRLAPELPTPITDLFGNQYFRLFIFALVLWTAQFSPSTAILISLAFMVSVNYATNKPLWELLTNEEPLPEVSVEVQAEPMPVPVVEPVPEVPEAVVELTDVVADAAPAPVVDDSLAPPTEAVEAVKELAQAAAAPEAAAVEDVKVAAETAMEAVTTPEAAQAVVQLTEQAMEPEAAPKDVVEKEAVVAMAGIPGVSEEKAKVEVAGCFPPRRFDVSNVVGYEPSLYEL